MRLRRLLGHVAAAIFGFLAGGLPGAALGVVTVSAARDSRRVISVPARLAPVALVVVTALATMLEAPIGRSDIGSDYATARELASTSSRLAAIMVFSLVVVAAQRTRASQPARAPIALPPASNPPMSIQLYAEPDRLAGWQYAALAIAAAVVRAVLAPAPLPTIHAEVANAIERGIAYGRPGAFVIGETAWVSPLAPVTAVATPFGPRFALIVIGSATVVAVAALATRLCGPRIGRGAGLLGVVAPALWTQQLPAALVTALVCAALLGWSVADRRFRRPLRAGFLVGLAVLASPSAIVALVVVAALAAFSPRRRDLAVFAVGAIIVLAPWQAWVAQNFDTLLPTTGVAPTLVAATDPHVRWGADIGAVAPFTIPAPDEEAERVDDAMASIAERAGWYLYPPLVTARALRAWDLWWPTNTVEQRTQRGLPNPGGAAAATAQGIIALLALGAVARRRGPQVAGPIVVAFAIAATVGAGLTYGEREVLAAAVPALLIAASVQLSTSMARWRPARAPAELDPADSNRAPAQLSEASATAASDE